jgi:hypothetical protein
MKAVVVVSLGVRCLCLCDRRRVQTLVTRKRLRCHLCRQAVGVRDVKGWCGVVKEKELEAIWLLSYGGGNFERGTQKKITEVQYLSLNKVWY